MLALSSEYLPRAAGRGKEQNQIPFAQEHLEWIREIQPEKNYMALCLKSDAFVEQLVPRWLSLLISLSLSFKLLLFFFFFFLGYPMIRVEISLQISNTRSRCSLVDVQVLTVQ